MALNVPLPYVIGFAVVAMIVYFIWSQRSTVKGLQQDVSNLVGMISQVPTTAHHGGGQPQQVEQIHHQQPMPRGNRASQVQMPTSGTSEQEAALQAMQAQYGDDTLDEMFN